ncbi:MAG: NUDIX hydrolase [Patescibacteria group bacterium]
MAELIHEIGQLPEKFGFKDCRRERAGFLSIYTFGSPDRTWRQDLMRRRDAVVILPVHFIKREIYLVEQPRLLRAFVETAEGMAALNQADNGEDQPFEVPVGAVLTPELPAGIIDQNESPREAAVRELREETGIAVPEATLEEIATYYPSVGGSTERLTAFIAKLDDNAEFTVPIGDGSELIRVWKMTWDEAFDMVRNGEIKTASSNLLLRELMLRDRNSR